MMPSELKHYFEQNPPPAAFELHPWAKIIENAEIFERFIMELSSFKGDYNDCPSYRRLKELYKTLRKTAEKPATVF